MKLLRKKYWFAYYLIVDTRSTIVGRGNIIYEQGETCPMDELVQKITDTVKEAHALTNRVVILRDFYKI